MTRLIKISYPIKLNLVKTFIEEVPSKNVYQCVEFFKKNIFSDKTQFKVEKIREKQNLRDIVNLHNDDGIKELGQVEMMTRQIESGNEILEPSKLPNIKIVKTREELVLFDGHHSMLAYMYEGRKYLCEVPHLIVTNIGGNVTDKEVLIFFGQHSSKLKRLDWRNYVINWQLSKEKQLCKRKQKNMGELFDSIKSF